MNSILLTVMLAMVGGAAPLVPSVSVAAEQEPSQMQTQKQAKEKIYGSQLMTRKERAEHRSKMRSLKTQEERDAYRLEHHKKMQERAKGKGMTLPDEPPATGMGMGGMRQGGGGMGPGGGGMGPGGGRDR